MLHKIRKFVPKPLFRAYHFLLSISGAIRYGFPAQHITTIGITGTSGKSTTVFLLGKILQAAGHKVGSSSTIEFCIGESCTLNKTKMTQLGRWGTQRFLSRIVREGCDIAIVETTSQGIEQFRHLGIDYDVVMLTNLYPEHIEAHGSFENYKNAKKKLFAYLSKTKRKSQVAKTMIVNGNTKEAGEFLAYPADQKWALHASIPAADKTLAATNIQVRGDGVAFTFDNTEFFVPLLGGHVIDNALAAIAAARAVGVDLATCARALANVTGIPGRAEFISMGQSFKVIVDFAFEPVAMEKLYEVVEKIPHQKIIHVLGGTGGGRDKARRPILGKMAGEHAALVIVTNEDPYDENPREIMEMVAAGARAAGKQDGDNLMLIDDRRAAIAYALQQAQENDIILVTGKGCEQAIVGPNRVMIPWDDRAVVREEFAKQVS